MDIAQYIGRLKQLADALWDVGQPVCETSQVLNMLRGLSSKYRHAILAITAHQSPRTFLSARSYLLLEEQYDKEHEKTTAQHAFTATSPRCWQLQLGTCSTTASDPASDCFWWHRRHASSEQPWTWMRSRQLPTSKWFPLSATCSWTSVNPWTGRV
jgi:erythromycin esterase-like protein